MGNDLQAESARLAALHAFELLDSMASEDFDRLCRLTAHSFGVPIALITLVDRDRQWFKARVGIDSNQTPLDQSFCNHTIRQREVLEVADAQLDPRFRDTGLVTGDPHIRFYAGAPLVTRDGHAIGSLCIIDTEPRQLDDAGRQRLEDFACLVMQQVETRQLLRRRQQLTGLANRQQFLADLHDLPTHCLGQERWLVLIEALDMNSAHEMAKAMGIGPCENLAIEFGRRLGAGLMGWANLYHISTVRFAFLATPLPEEEKRLDALLETLRQPMIVRGVPINPPVHAGVVQLRVHPDHLKDALRMAMSALDTARATRQPWALYDARHDQQFCRAYNLAADLPEALRRNELYPVFQPRLDIASGVVTGAELLLRWQHPELEKIAPAEFIPVIEKTALIHLVTRWVIEAAVAQLASWKGRFDGKLSINLSPRNFEEGHLVDDIRAACSRYGVNPARLEMEITEGEWLHCNGDVLSQLSAMRALGIDVAIDDFGNGYSNFSYLQEIPANVLKLDMSLIQGLESNPRNQLVVRSLIELARQLGYRTVAEGVETAESFRLVKSYGCDEAQGYFIAAPMVIDAFDTWQM